MKVKVAELFLTRACRKGVVTLALLPALAGLLIANSGIASTITVNSPSFENPGTILGFWAFLDPAWTPTTVNQFSQNFSDNIDADSPLWSVLLPGTGLISQDLMTTVNAGDTLSVSFRGGSAKSSSSTVGGGVGIARFTVGATDYSDTFDTTGLSANTWATYTLTKTITNTGNLTLKFGVSSANPWLDTISAVTVTPAVVPEPASASLLVCGMVGLMLVRKRHACVI